MSRAAVLDLDMTLISSSRKFYAALEKFMRDRLGEEPPTWEEFAAAMGDPGGWLQFVPREARTAFWERFDELSGGVPVEPMPLAYRALDELRGMGYEIVVLSGRRTGVGSVISDLREAGLLGLVDVAASVGRTSKAAAIREILEYIDAAPAECLVVGDRPEDVAAGVEVGVGLVVGVLSGWCAREDLLEAGADVVIPGIWALPVELHARGVGGAVQASTP